MKKTASELKIESADEFRNEDMTYSFPFIGLDPTPGGSNLGRIMWGIEAYKKKRKDGRYYITSILVWARQTRDARYAGRIFEIPCFTESLYGSVLGEKVAFLHRVWRAFFCDEHGGLVLQAYPDDQHTELYINAGSSIMIDLEFR